MPNRKSFVTTALLLIPFTISSRYLFRLRGDESNKTKATDQVFGGYMHPFEIRQDGADCFFIRIYSLEHVEPGKTQ